MKKKNNYDNKYSIAHWDGCENDDFFFNCFTNSSEQWKKEIYDIYFGSTFLHRDVTYGDTMGTNISQNQYRNLLEIQEKYGIPLSLTLNEMNRPVEMLRRDIIKDLITFIGKFYDDGIRSCTISHTHLMKTGALQETFPDMNWKNTVNHGIKTTQQFIDYVNLGYNTIQLDRDFNRNHRELKRTKKEADRLGVKTCLLIREGCMPECPYKTEHDCWQGAGYFRTINSSYWDSIKFTCNKWRSGDFVNHGLPNPRTATDIMIHSKEDWDDFADIVDIFKVSGRLIRYPKNHLEKFGYYFLIGDKIVAAESFKEIYENNLSPFLMWYTYHTVEKDHPMVTDIDEIKKLLAGHFWNTDPAKTLCKILKNCKNQCYSCHKCDELFMGEQLDSLISL